PGFACANDKTCRLPPTNDKGERLEQVLLDPETGKKRVLFDATRLESAAKKVAGVSADEAKKLTTQRNWNFSPNKKSVILTLGDDLYLYAFDADSVTRLT